MVSYVYTLQKNIEMVKCMFVADQIIFRWRLAIPVEFLYHIIKFDKKWI